MTLTIADDSPPGSPARKRQRLSSPTYDEQLGDLSQDDLAAFDEIEFKLSQAQPVSSKWKGPELNLDSGGLQVGQLDFSNDRSRTTDHIPDDPENPFSAVGNNRRSTRQVPLSGFASASALPTLSADQERYPSPAPDEEPPDQDFSKWFAPAHDIIPEASFFSAASTTFSGFQSASKKGTMIPSAAALAKAQSKMLNWEKQDIVPDTASTASHTITSGTQAGLVASQTSTPQRPPLRSVENIPSTPSPARASQGSKIAMESSTFSTASGMKKGNKPFISPFVTKPNFSATPSVSSRLNPNVHMSSSKSSTLPPTAIAITPAPASRSQRPGFSTPARTPVSLHRGIQKRATPAFKTPFKPGMKPGEPGRSILTASHKASHTPTLPTSEVNMSQILTQGPPRAPELTKVFDLTPRSGRVSLLASGLRPGMYTEEHLEAKAINVGELAQITPTTAVYYSFHSESTPVAFRTQKPPDMGPKQAYRELLEKGCDLVKQDWVDNHWGQILWKLAAMVVLDPDSEGTGEQKWTYQEVIRQLLYRYEREINQGKRPALRLVTTRDAPAAYPMVLCVSNIFWTEGGVGEDGISVEPHPTLEVTDGWYRLRAQVDEPMARATRRGIIRVGRKFTIAGARISSEKKEPAEPLEAYETTTLILSGNSTHLAPWHTKMGFTLGPWVSTMNSLTGDGGLVAVMDVVVVKVHKLGFIEFYEDEDGNKRSRPPIDEAGEAKAQQDWEKKRESETNKMHDEYERKWYRYEGYMDRLERRAQAKHFRHSQDYAPTYAIESLYDDLEDPAKAAEICATLDGTRSGWLAQHIKQQITMERNCVADRIRDDVNEICPPREVRSFRVLIVEDARTLRKPATRKAQLNVWDVLKLSLSEDSEMGDFRPGQRFLIMNTLPTHPSAWMAPGDEESEIYLRTTPNTRWTTFRS